MKHGSPASLADRSVPDLARDLAFFDADCVIATGQRTGRAASLEKIELVGGVTHLPLLVGSGLTAENVGPILSRTNDVIVASSLKEGGVW